MGVTIGSNSAILGPQRKLSRSTARLASINQKLASGQRINRASDDAAGLAIADALRADSRVLVQAHRNLNGGVSFLDIADSVIQELSGILIRQYKLAERAANGTNHFLWSNIYKASGLK